MSEGGRGGGGSRKGLGKASCWRGPAGGDTLTQLERRWVRGGGGGVRGGDWGWGRGYGLRDLHINTRIARITIITRLLEYWISYNNY